jgi:hypothetical protein
MARNAVIDRQGIISSHRGFRYGYDLYEPGSAIFEYLKYPLILDGTTLRYDADGLGTLSDWPGHYSPPPGQKMRGIETDEQFLFTTEQGPFIQESPTSTPRRAGVPQGLDIKLTTFGDGLGGSLPPDHQVSYRVVFGNGNRAPGSPSHQEVIANLAYDVTLAAAGTTVVVTQTAHGYTNGDTIQIIDPVEVTYIAGPHIITWIDADRYSYTVGVSPITATTTGKAGKTLSVQIETPVPFEVGPDPWWVEIHRTFLSADALTWPGDTHFKVTRHIITIGEAVSGKIIYPDSKADDFLRLELYTNPGTREGMAGANDRPPYAEHIVEWRGHVHYLGNVRWEHMKEVTLEALMDLHPGDQFQIVSQGVTYPFAAGTTEDPTTTPPTFKVWTSETLESVNIRLTAKSLIHCINASGAPVYAHYPWTEVGLIHLVRKDLSDIPFYLTASDTDFGECFSPDLPTSGETVASDAGRKPHFVSRAKFQKPECVPRLNGSEVGKLGQEVLGAQSLTDCLLVFCYAGMWQITGNTDGLAGRSFVTKEVDRTLRLLNPDCLCSLDTVSFGWFSSGLCRASPGASLIVSTNIDLDLRKVTKYQGFPKAYFVPYESEHKLYVWIPSSSASQVADVAYIYDYLQNVWTGPLEKPAAAAAVIDDYLYICRSDRPKVSVERKTYVGCEDYIDEEDPTTVSVTGTTTWSGRTVSTVTVAWTGIDLLEGWLFNQVTTLARSAIVSAVDNGDGTWALILNDLMAPTAGAATLAPPVDFEFWTDEAFGDGALDKHLGNAVIVFDTGLALHHEVGFSSNMIRSVEWLDEIIQESDGGWGFDWGFDWGGSGVPEFPLLIPIPHDTAVCQILRTHYRHRWALEKVDILEIAFFFTTQGEKVVKTPR